MAIRPSEQLWRLDATAQAELVQRGGVPARDLVELAIARVETLNSTLNAVIEPLFTEARATAMTIDLAAPFAGVPIMVKDASLQIEGTRYSVGMILEWFEGRPRGLRSARYAESAATALATRAARRGRGGSGRLPSAVQLHRTAGGLAAATRVCRRPAGRRAVGRAA